MTEPGAIERDEAEPARQRITARQPVPGRLAALCGMSLIVGAIPIPFLPDRVLKQLRGAVAHEAASRHGLSLSSDARDALARVSMKSRMRNVIRKGLQMLMKRMLRGFGPLSALGAAAGAVEVFALGHLLDRYLTRVRSAGTVRIQEVEALRMRRVIDAAVALAFHPSTEPRPLLLTQGAEDLRDEFTRWFDMVLLGSATVPSYLARRLEAAFDEVVGRSPELVDDEA